MSKEKIETKYTIYYPDGKTEERSAMLWSEPDYAALREIIKPILAGDMEHVSVLHNDKIRDMFVDENGRLKGLQPNRLATAIYRANWLKRFPNTKPDTLSGIVGIAIIFDRRVWF